MDKKFIDVDIREYVKHSQEPRILATKNATVIARCGIKGEVINTYTQHSEIESTVVVKDFNQWVITKAKDGEPIVDENGNVNSWVVEDSYFNKNYEKTDKPDVFVSKSAVRTFISVKEDISFLAPFGMQKLEAGGYLNITDENAIYGVSERDFKDTYKREDKIVFLSLLYDKPLFDWPSADGTVKVLIMGDDSSTYPFIDAILEAGQFGKSPLDVEVAVDKRDEFKNDYLSKRGELVNFFDVDGSLKDKNVESYGRITFKELDIDANAIGSARFIFINIKDSVELAKEITSLSNADGRECFVAGLDGDYLYYIQNGEKVIFSGFNQELEKMAFNTHLLWDNSPNKGNADKKAAFLGNKYNRESSLSSALSIKNKLWYLGIVSDNPFEAAKEFERIEDKKVIGELIALEHRRWVVNSICQGIKALDEQTDPFNICLTKHSIKIRDENGKVIIHPCIVRSTSAMPLSNGFNRWDAGSIDELDELDKLSVGLYRFFKKHADDYKAIDPFKKHGVYLDLEDLVRKAKSMELTREYNRFIFAVKNIIDGSAGYAKQFESVFKHDFLQKVKELRPTYLTSFNNLVSIITNELFPCLQSCLRIDYKAIDEVLVKNIPFILTYRDDCVVAQGFDESNSLTGSSDTLFQNVASLVVIKPKKVIFLLDVGDTTRKELLAKTVCSAKSFIDDNVFAEVELLIHGIKAKDPILDSLPPDIKCTIVPKNDSIAFVLKTLKEKGVTHFNGSVRAFKSQHQNALFINEVFNNFKYYEFYSPSKTFTVCSNADELRYIRDNSFLRVVDMFCLTRPVRTDFRYPDYGSTYKELWSIYTNNANKNTNPRTFGDAVHAWNYLCAAISTIRKNEHMNPEPTVHRFTVAQIRDVSCGMKCPRRDSVDGNDPIESLLRRLNKGGFIKTNTMDVTPHSVVSFTISDPSILELLSQAGMILEIYIYFECVKLGYFDDIVNSFAFKYEESDVENELDLVLTKGFKSIIVECKATMKLDQIYYHKLNSIIDLFGVSTTRVVAWNDYFAFNGHRVKNDNLRQELRGRFMDIYTVSDYNELINIGLTLKRLMED